jgi:hypothetical protein
MIDRSKIKLMIGKFNFGIFRRLALVVIGWEGGGRLSYSQEGEDIIISKYFPNSEGFYIDIGAFRPIRYSNSYLFSKKGWMGINIDATPGTMKDFTKIRPRDININRLIAREKQDMTFFQFDRPEFNTINENNAFVAQNKYGAKLINQTLIESVTLEEVLDLHMPINTQIDFMSVDVEGSDLEVLYSNNWEKYKPKMIIIESMDLDLENLYSNEVYNFLNSIGYRLASKLFYSSIYIID